MQVSLSVIVHSVESKKTGHFSNYSLTNKMLISVGRNAKGLRICFGVEFDSHVWNTVSGAPLMLVRTLNWACGLVTVSPRLHHHLWEQIEKKDRNAFIAIEAILRNIKLFWIYCCYRHLGAFEKIVQSTENLKLVPDRGLPYSLQPSEFHAGGSMSKFRSGTEVS